MNFALKRHRPALINAPQEKTFASSTYILGLQQITACNELRGLFDELRDERLAVYHFSSTNVTSLLITYIMANLQLSISPGFLINVSLSDGSCHFASKFPLPSRICKHFGKKKKNTTFGRHTCHLQSRRCASEGAC